MEPGRLAPDGRGVGGATKEVNARLQHGNLSRSTSTYDASASPVLAAAAAVACEGPPIGVEVGVWVPVQHTYTHTVWKKNAGEGEGGNDIIGLQQER